MSNLHTALYAIKLVLIKDTDEETNLEKWKRNRQGERSKTETKEEEKQVIEQIGWKV